jgi:large subunit ribosomal protein L5
MAEEKENKSREFKIEKVILNIGGVGEKLDKGVLLLEKISGKKAVRVKAVKRIPAWSVRPGQEVGKKVTIRGPEALEMLKRLLPAIDNTIKARQIQDNFFSFGIHEYVEIPGIEYMREVGMMGLEVTCVFSRQGKSVEKKKVKRGKIKRLVVAKEEIINFLETKFKTEIIPGKK